MLLFVLQLAFGVFGPNPISDLITAVIAFLPKLIVAIIIVVVASAIAAAVKTLIEGSLGGLSYGKTLAKVSRARSSCSSASIAALNQVGVATTVTTPVLIAILATIAGVIVVGVGGGPDQADAAPLGALPDQGRAGGAEDQAGGRRRAAASRSRRSRPRPGPGQVRPSRARVRVRPGPVRPDQRRGHCRRVRHRWRNPRTDRPLQATRLTPTRPTAASTKEHHDQHGSGPGPARRRRHGRRRGRRQDRQRRARSSWTTRPASRSGPPSRPACSAAGESFVPLAEAERARATTLPSLRQGQGQGRPPGGRQRRPPQPGARRPSCTATTACSTPSPRDSGLPAGTAATPRRERRTADTDSAASGRSGRTPPARPPTTP